MSYLFEISDKRVFPHVETLLISPFKEIWERDKSKRKEVALQELAYIEFMTSAKKSNPFRGYDESKKDIAVREEVIKIEKWKPDALVLAAMKKIKKFQEEASPTYSYFITVKESLEDVKNFLKTVDLHERNSRGVPVYKIKDITDAAVGIDKILQSFKSLEKKVEQDLFEETKIKSGKEISYFATPESVE